MHHKENIKNMAKFLNNMFKYIMPKVNAIFMLLSQDISCTSKPQNPANPVISLSCKADSFCLPKSGVYSSIITCMEITLTL